MTPSPTGSACYDGLGVAADGAVATARPGAYLDRPLEQVPEAVVPFGLPDAEGLRAQLAQTLDQYLQQSVRTERSP
ncbi:MAG TPA: hypothetical protein VH008_01750 [Pseudonocardia sp.]|jgi:hypothetical protein|nr:hypothetical protein [Pseudonocardia sp.]